MSCREPGCLIEKDPSSIEPYGFDWTAWLVDILSSETIVSSSWAVAPSGLTLSSASIVTDSLKTQVKASGGTLGTRYTLTNSIVTSGGFQDDRTFFVLIKEQ